jgi:hypothetical protein
VSIQPWPPYPITYPNTALCNIHSSSSLSQLSLLGLIHSSDLDEVGKLNEIDGKLELESVSHILQALEVEYMLIMLFFFQV